MLVPRAQQEPFRAVLKTIGDKQLVNILVEVTIENGEILVTEYALPPVE
jgi:hypothetical protein